VSNRDIAQIHGLRSQPVREIVRSEGCWHTRYDPQYATLRDEHPTRPDSAFELQDMLAAIPQTRALWPDP